MEGGHGPRVHAHLSTVVVQEDVITITLCTPEPHQAPPLQLPTVNHVTEHQLSLIEESASLQTCRRNSSQVLRRNNKILQVRTNQTNLNQTYNYKCSRKEVKGQSSQQPQMAFNFLQERKDVNYSRSRE